MDKMNNSGELEPNNSNGPKGKEDMRNGQN